MSTRFDTDPTTIDIRVLEPERFTATYTYNLITQEMEPSDSELAAITLRATNEALGRLARSLDSARSALSDIADYAASHAHRIEDKYGSALAVSTFNTWWISEGMAKTMRIATLLDVAGDETRAMAKSAYDHAERVSPREEDR